jgi:hypothetical protein
MSDCIPDEMTADAIASMKLDLQTSLLLTALSILGADKDNAHNIAKFLFALLAIADDTFNSDVRARLVTIQSMVGHVSLGVLDADKWCHIRALSKDLIAPASDYLCCKPPSEHTMRARWYYVWLVHSTVV